MIAGFRAGLARQPGRVAKVFYVIGTLIGAVLITALSAAMMYVLILLFVYLCELAGGQLAVWLGWARWR